MMTEDLYNHSIFWIEVDKIKPNPYQPRQEFDEDKIKDLAESIRQYGVLQPLVVTRKEKERPDGGLYTEYELIAGERRLRASKVAGIYQVPAIIRTGEQTDKMKLEMAIIENLQREDLNPLDRAEAFMKLVKEFNLKHAEVAKKVGKSREYVSNSLRILALPQDILDALVARKISEGHTRPLLMLAEKPEEQLTLFQEIVVRRLTVREAEQTARRIAVGKVRTKDYQVDPNIIEAEERLSQRLGAKVRVEKREKGGRLTISFVSPEDLHKILTLLNEEKVNTDTERVETFRATEEVLTEGMLEDVPENAVSLVEEEVDEDLYSVRNFSL